MTAFTPSRAKINLFLEITGKRADGFHNLESVFVETTLADEIRVSPKPGSGDITLQCDAPGIPLDDGNLAVKAALALRKRFPHIRGGLHIELRKTIPSGAGLGGGSSNAAATLALANRLWECGLGREELAEIGSEVGSDVPFFCHGGTCLCRGRGEKVEQLMNFPKKVEIGLALPSIHSNTGEAFAKLRLPPEGEVKTADAFVAAMRAGDVEAMAAAAFNRLEECVFAAKPDLARLHRELRGMLGRNVGMSGTGSALWFFAGDSGESWEADSDIARWAEKNRVALATVRTVDAERSRI